MRKTAAKVKKYLFSGLVIIIIFSSTYHKINKKLYFCIHNLWL